jgi:hypothetical protein
VVYLASRDGWDPAVLRDRCNDKHNLLILAASSSPAHGGNGSRATHIFGGFTSLPWQRHGGFKEDPSAHLFSLRAAGPGGKESPVPQMFRCEQVRLKDHALMHYTTLTEYDGKFWSGGLLFGAGPDLHIDLDNPARCITQLGSTYELPKPCAVSEEGPAFLAGSSPFEALDVGIYQMVNFRAVNAAEELAAQRAARHQVDLDRIHSIGEWLEDQNIESSHAFAEGRKEKKPLSLSPALIITRPIMDVLTKWFNCPDLKLGKCLYLASRDGFSNDTFHDKVDGVGPATCMLVRTASRFLFGSFNTVPWQSKKRLVDVDTGAPRVVADDIGTWAYDENAFLFRIEPGPPVMLPQQRKTAYSVRHRHGEGPTFGERGADLAIDLDKPHRSRSMLGGTYTCPAGANDRTFLAGSYSGWPILDVAFFQVHPRPPRNEDDDVLDGGIIGDEAS